LLWLSDPENVVCPAVAVYRNRERVPCPNVRPMYGIIFPLLNGQRMLF